MPKISVITVCYNSEKTIQDTLHSVATQDYSNLEYLILDGQSSDSTMNIVQSALPSLPQNTAVSSEKDKGLYDAMNKGIAKASGEIIGFLNSDDVFAGPSSIRQIAEIFEKTKADIVYGNIVYTKQYDLSSITRSWRPGNPPPSGMKFGWHPPHPAFYVKRDLLNRLGGFNLNYRIAADYEMMVRLIAKHQLRLAWCDHTIVRMREGGVSNAGLKSIWRANVECWQAWKENGLTPSPVLIAGKLTSKILQYGSKPPNR
jgi:glycosyltransferase involved in cell wall biosynthesis